jgi:ribosome modulation factor
MKVYDPHDYDRDDAEYDKAEQELLDAFAEGKRAGLQEQRIETNPYISIDAAYTHWIDGWREGIAQVLQPRRAA